MINNSVEKYMTKSPVIIYENSTLESAWTLLKSAPFKHLPVLSASEKITGILSSTDVKNLSTLFENSQSDISSFLSNLTVKDVMSTHVVSIQKNASMEEANDLILSKGIRALPVIDDNNIIGILSETDILHYYNEKYKSVD